MYSLQRFMPWRPIDNTVATTVPARTDIPPDVKTITINSIKSPPKNKSNRFFRKGMGIASTTVTKHIFDQRTTTPTPSCRVIQPFDGNRLKLHNPAPVPTIGNEPRPTPIMKPPPNGALGNMKKESRHFYHFLGLDNYFPQDRSSHACREAFSDALSKIEKRLDRTKAPTTEDFGGAEMVIVTGAVARATKNHGGSMGDSARALAFLSNVNLIQSILHPEGSVTPGTEPCPDVRGIRRRQTRPEFDKNDQSLAWSIAHELATTSVGFAALKKICHREPEPHPATELRESIESNVMVPPDEKVEQLKKLKELEVKYDAVAAKIAAHDDLMLRLYLKGAREKLLETLPDLSTPAIRRSHPAVIKVDRDRHSRSNWGLLDKGLTAIEEHLNESAIYSAALRDTVFSGRTRSDGSLIDTIPEMYVHGTSCKRWPVKDLNEWAITAIRNGVYTDKPKDAKGNPTLFFLMQERLNKNDIWVDRSIKKPPAATTKEKLERFATKAKIFAVPSQHKVPYKALNISPPIKKNAEIGMPPEGVIDGFGNSVQGAIRDSRHHKALIQILAERIRNGDPAIGHRPIDASELPRDKKERHSLLRKMARLAILEHSLEKPEYLWRIPHADSLKSERDLQRAKARLPKFVTGIGGVDELVFESYIDAFREGLTPAKLERWGRRVGAPGHGDVVPETIDGEPNPWFKWSESLNRAYGNKPYTDTKDAFESKAKLAAAFAGGIREGELGSRTTLMSNGKHGAGTKGLTFLLSRFLLSGFSGVRVDLRAENTPQAVVEFGTGAQGSELFFGKQKSWRFQGGGGVAAGIPVATSPVFVSATADAYAAHENVDQTGVVIRLPRTETGIAGDQINNEKLGEIMKRIIDRPTPPRYDKDDPDPLYGQCFALGKDAESSLKNLWQEWPEISTSWVDANETINSIGASGRAGLAVGVGNARFGLGGIGVGEDGKETTLNHVESDGAALGVIKCAKGNVTTTNMAGGIGSIGAAFKVSGAGDAAVSILGKQLAVSIPTLDVMNAQVTLARSGCSTKDTIIMRDGVVHRTSYRLVTYQTAADFEKAVSPKLGIYASVKWRKHGVVQGVPSHIHGRNLLHEAHDRNEGLEKQHRKGEEFLQKTLASAAPSQLYQEYFELKPETVDVANAVLSLRATAAHMGDVERVKEHDDFLAQLYADDNSWEETFLIQVEQQVTQDMTQLNAGIRHARGLTKVTTNLMDGH